MRQERLDKILPHIGGSALYRSRLRSPTVGGGEHKSSFFVVRFRSFCEEKQAKSVRAGKEAKRFLGRDAVPSASFHLNATVKFPERIA